MGFLNAREAMMTTIAEELLLLALDDDKGTVSLNQSTSLPLGLAGALLAELALRDRVHVEGKHLLVHDPAPTDDPLLDEALTTIAGSKKPHDAKHWVSKLSGKLKERLIKRLVERGVLREEECKILWVIPSSRYPAMQTSDEAAARERLRAVVLPSAEPDPRTVALLGLVKACDLEKKVFQGDEWKRAKPRVKELLEGELYGKAVGDAVAAATAAVIASTSAATMAATVAATSSS
jgi:hypothetical protein